MHELIVTREDANSESALLVEWLVDDGGPVARDQPVCVIETTKAAIELVAPADGTLWQLVEAGSSVPLGGGIALVAADGQEAAEAQRRREESRSAVGAEPAPAGSTKATRKALELAAEHGIDIGEISKPGFVTAEDVEELLAARARGSVAEGIPAAVSHLLAAIPLDRVSLPDSLRDDETAGALDEGFLDMLRAEPDTIAALPGDKRLELYREHGASIGEGVVLGEGTLIRAARIVLGDGVEIGDGSLLECSEVLCVGAGTKLGTRLRLRCRRTYIGTGVYFSEDVHVGGGGSDDPQALLTVGDLTFLGTDAFVNPCRPILIGRETFVTMRSVLVTHNIGHSVVEGFENRFAPIVLEDRSQVGIGAVVYAGCRIGEKSIVASNSYVVSDIPPGRLAIGVPARAVGRAHRTLSAPEQVAAAERMTAELQELLELRGHEVEPLAETVRGFRVATGGSVSQVLFVPRLDASFAPPAVDGETVVLTLSLEGEAPPGVSVLDLLGHQAHSATAGVVLDSVREFCRKRGIRFDPGPWRYRGGLI